MRFLTGEDAVLAAVSLRGATGAQAHTANRASQAVFRDRLAECAKSIKRRSNWLA